MLRLKEEEYLRIKEIRKEIKFVKERVKKEVEVKAIKVVKDEDNHCSGNYS
ncbi:MAG: hypothetical protein PHQ52_01465 [Candidatus Omnitrophica bacterium]|nr:hypothetical protein [Candidatus Omnitrophota bacterium]